jgi:hypothetical protein
MKNLLPVLFFLFSCQKSDTQPDPPAGVVGYESIPQSIALSGSIPEASGIADSKANTGYLWVEEDSGNPPVIYLLKHDGAVSSSVTVEGATNRDWEDIVLANGPESGKNYLYIGDLGDNDLTFADYSIYRFIEPVASASSVNSVDRIDFTYPDGSHDTEAFLVDNNTKDIYLITKRDQKSKVYRLPYPQSTNAMNQAVFVADLSFTGVVSAALSDDGKEMIIKTYPALYYYTKDAAEPISEVIKRSPKTLDYKLEAQGEAVCFTHSNTGFFTLSEEAMGTVPSLNFYKRK